MKRALTMSVMFKAQFVFDEILVDPLNTIELELEKTRFLDTVRQNHSAEWDEMVEIARKNFSKMKVQTTVENDTDRLDEDEGDDADA